MALAPTMWPGLLQSEEGRRFAVEFQHLSLERCVRVHVCVKGVGMFAL